MFGKTSLVASPLVVRSHCCGQFPMPFSSPAMPYRTAVSQTLFDMVVTSAAKSVTPFTQLSSLLLGPLVLLYTFESRYTHRELTALAAVYIFFSTSRNKAENIPKIMT